MGGITIPKVEKVQQDKPSRYRRVRNCLNNNSGIIIAVHSLLTTGLIVFLIVLLALHNGFFQKPTTDTAKSAESELPLENTTISEVVTDSPANLSLVPRLEWLANAPVAPPTPLATPVPYVIIQHTASENCSSQAQCMFHVRFIQTFHMENKNWWDIGYNFLVGGDGKSYEGRGWTSEGAHTYGYNARSVGIAFIGTFNSYKPPRRQIRACQLLIQKGVELGHIRKDYKVLAARQLQDTESPGAMLYEDIKTWDHWERLP